MARGEWKPGDVAERSYLGFIRPSMRVQSGPACRENHDRGDHWHHSDGGWDSDRGSSTYRPLVVIDPDDREQVERLGKAFHESDHIAPWHDLHRETTGQIVDAMQAALRSLIAPPLPEEPTGLGAVVEDKTHVKWVRAGHSYTDPNWRRSGGDEWHRYDDIAAVKVLSEGVPS